MRVLCDSSEKVEEYKAEANEGMKKDAEASCPYFVYMPPITEKRVSQSTGIKNEGKGNKIMSMEVSGNYRDCKNDYLERLQEGRDKTKEVVKEQSAGNRNESILVPKDEYISSKQYGSRPSGLYYMGRDEHGNSKVLYDDPKKTSAADKKEQPKVGADSPEEDAEKCTTNTDKVDREIKKLKEQKQQLEQQIKAASGDEEKVKELEKKLSQIEGELSQKDNDTYRRQNAVIS